MSSGSKSYLEKGILIQKSAQEHYIDDEAFAELVQESADRIKARQETDSIELLDDIRYYLSERFRLRFEDSGLEDMMDDEPTEIERKIDGKLPENVGVSVGVMPNGGAARGSTKFASETMMTGGTIRTLDGEIAGDQLEGDALNYQILLGKIDGLLDSLRLDA